MLVDWRRDDLVDLLGQHAARYADGEYLNAGRSRQIRLHVHTRARTHDERLPLMTEGKGSGLVAL